MTQPRFAWSQDALESAYANECNESRFYYIVKTDPSQ